MPMPHIIPQFNLVQFNMVCRSMSSEKPYPPSTPSVRSFPKHCLSLLQPNGHLSERTDNFCEVQAQGGFHRSHLLPEVNVPVVPVLKMPLSSTCSDPVGDPKLCRLSCFSMRSNRRFTLLLALFRIPRSESVCRR